MFIALGKGRWDHKYSNAYDARTSTIASILEAALALSNLVICETQELKKASINGRSMRGPLILKRALLLIFSSQRTISAFITWHCFVIIVGIGVNK